jgi:hypothetical protein
LSIRTEGIKVFSYKTHHKRILAGSSDPILVGTDGENWPAFALLKERHIHFFQYGNRAASALAILPVVGAQ